jgi:endonuclease III
VAEDVVEVKEGESVYAMVDGSMLLTRENSWSEVKLGRIFKSSDNIDISEERGWIRRSLYDAYLGSCKTFTWRFEVKLDAYECLNENLIFITDGAPWIKNWIQDAYPKATQVLDYYHAFEHLCGFAKEYFKDEQQKHDWIERQKTLLHESQVEQVIANIISLQTKQKKIKKIKNDLLQYYQGNKDRMDYKRYKTMGAGLIGSGAIESAHRTVIQKRMKQAGQRWSKKRAQNMLTLRCTRLSGKWNKVVQLICSNEAKAA